MTKSNLRKARKIARLNNMPLIGELAIVKNTTASNRTLRRKASRIRAAARKSQNTN
jgi:hypothetical protein